MHQLLIDPTSSYEFFCLTGHRLTGHRLTGHRLTGHRLPSHRLTGHPEHVRRPAHQRRRCHRFRHHQGLQARRPLRTKDGVLPNRQRIRAVACGSPDLWALPEIRAFVKGREQLIEQMELDAGIDVKVTSSGERQDARSLAAQAGR